VRVVDAGGVTLLDVRTDEEYAEGHAPWAKHIPRARTAVRRAV
jgi:rhodanese-related sulfurtransferase